MGWPELGPALASWGYYAIILGFVAFVIACCWSAFDPDL